MRTIRFDTDSEPIVVVTDRIVYAKKITSRHVEIRLDTGETVTVREQLNVVEARIALSE